MKILVAYLPLHSSLQNLNLSKILYTFTPRDGWGGGVVLDMGKGLIRVRGAGYWIMIKGEEGLIRAREVGS